MVEQMGCNNSKELERVRAELEIEKTKNKKLDDELKKHKKCKNGKPLHVTRSGDVSMLVSNNK